MGRAAVSTPAGESWRVRRLWAPRLGGRRLWARVRRRFRKPTDFPDSGLADPTGCLPDALDEFFLVLGLFLAVLLVVLLAVFVVVPLLLALLDLVVVLVLALLGVLARVLLRRPWTVEAEACAGPRAGTVITWRVVGWRASGEHAAQVAEALRAGVDLPPGGVAIDVRGADRG